ncbi:MAG: hypothetical protein ACRYGP_14525 [Janthinobacterium lividum]
MSTSQSAFSALKDLRAEIDQRLAQIEDYRVLRALDKAILEVRLVTPVTVENKTLPVTEPAEAKPNPVGAAQQALKTGVSDAFSYRVPQAS